ncbi:MAG: DUF4091 domain-containing protein [Candidatus Magasanikbacteria bacterium]|nr:DUF4091 domain-containing protein [Candidatus Magasanikbacteria bacterium]
MKCFASLFRFPLSLFLFFIFAFALFPTESFALDLRITHPLESSALNSSAIQIKWTDVKADYYEVAVGSSPALPDYGWYANLKKPKLLIKKLPFDGSTVYIRVFAYVNGSVFTTDSHFRTYRKPRSPLISEPLKKTKLSSDSLYISWLDVGADSYEVLLGSKARGSDLARLSSKDNSVSIFSLPKDGRKLFITVRAAFGTKIRQSSTYVFAFKESLGQTLPLPTPTPTPTPSTPIIPAPTPTSTPLTADNNQDQAIPTLPLSFGSLSAVWANTGEDKVVQEDLRATHDAFSVQNSAWDGAKIKMFGARNEVVNANLILEASTKNADAMSVTFDKLSGPGGFSLFSKSLKQNDDLFNWVGRNIELFYVRYLEIQGISKFIGSGLQYPNGISQLPNRWQGTSWPERPDHNKNYPEIAVPLELENTFSILQGKNQSIWIDVYIPKNAPAGLYSGNFNIYEKGQLAGSVPVELQVLDFSLPDRPTVNTMLYLGNDMAKRYFADAELYTPLGQKEYQSLRDRHFMLAHRHKISLIDSDPEQSAAEPAGQPSSAWVPRLSGALFTSAMGYEGPGLGVGNGVYSIGSYGSWPWKGQGKDAMWKHTDAWANWFKIYSPGTDYFLYLIDESSDYNQTNTWAAWINQNPGPGSAVRSAATIPLTEVHHTPELDIPISGMYLGDPAVWESHSQNYLGKPGKSYYMYNGGRPGSGSWVTEDDGVALRELAWGQYKKHIDRWFYWESTYYNNYQGGTGQTDLYKQAQTFGGHSGYDNYYGETGWNYSNGDGVLFYPGTDRVYPDSSYGIKGPIASLRLKYWRRGIQDTDYLALAEKKNSAATQAILQKILPKALWENGVDNVNDPTYVTVEHVSWPTDPDLWEQARKDLATIIQGI